MYATTGAKARSINSVCTARLKPVPFHNVTRNIYEMDSSHLISHQGVPSFDPVLDTSCLGTLRSDFLYAPWRHQFSDEPLRKKRLPLPHLIFCRNCCANIIRATLPLNSGMALAGSLSRGSFGDLGGRSIAVERC